MRMIKKVVVIFVFAILLIGILGFAHAYDRNRYLNAKAKGEICEGV